MGGRLVNLLAGYLAWRIGRRGWRVRDWNASWVIATIVETALISVVVGGYLSIVFSTPLAVEIPLILAGDIVAINIVGFALLSIIGETRILNHFRSWGLRTNATEKNR